MLLRQSLSHLVTIAIALLLTSCASHDLMQSEADIAAVNETLKTSEKSLEALLSDYDNKLAALDKNRLTFYAPLNMKAAELKVANVRAKTKNDADQGSKFELISALRHIDQASKNKLAVKLHLKKSDTLFTELQKLDAHVSIPKQFSDVAQQFKELIMFIELGKTQESIQQEPDLIKEMIEVEIAAIKEKYFGEAAEHIEKAKELGAKDFTPYSLNQSETLMNDALAFIQKSHRDRSVITQKAAETKNAAQKLFFVAKETEALHHESNKVIEQKVISAYDFLKAIEVALSFNPIEIKDYSTQRDELLELIKAQQQEALNKTQLTVCEPIKAPVQAITKEIIVQPVTPKVMISEETQKAILPELFAPTNSSTIIETDEVNLNFDSIEIVK